MLLRILFFMNLYVHFPFCRNKCRYCALYSRTNISLVERNDYARTLASALKNGVCPKMQDTDKPLSSKLETVYFGGGSPALCDLSPLFIALAPLLSDQTEFTVELHPLDVTDETLSRLRDGGVNRISMGVQSLDDATLSAMERGYTALEASHAFACVKRFFQNAGTDLIVGYPGDPCKDYSSLTDWGQTHVSVYSLQNERKLKDVPNDDWVLDRICDISSFLASIGLERYEISNYAIRGFECRHNLAVWRGEDYIGIGDGAYGRIGCLRTRNLGVCQQIQNKEPPLKGLSPMSPRIEKVTTERDEVERKIFRLRTREGLDITGHPKWRQTLEAHLKRGLLTREGNIYRLTSRGMEVCDSILADLVY